MTIECYTGPRPTEYRIAFYPKDAKLRLVNLRPHPAHVTWSLRDGQDDELAEGEYTLAPDGFHTVHGIAAEKTVGASLSVTGEGILVVPFVARHGSLVVLDVDAEGSVQAPLPPSLACP